MEAKPKQISPRGPSKSYFMCPSSSQQAMSEVAYEQMRANLEASSLTDKEDDLKQIQIKINKTLTYLTGSELVFCLFLSEDESLLMTKILGDEEVPTVRLPIANTGFQTAILNNQAVFSSSFSPNDIKLLSQVLNMQVQNLLCMPQEQESRSTLLMLVCLVNKRMKVQMKLERLLRLQDNEICGVVEFTSNDITSIRKFLSIEISDGLRRIEEGASKRHVKLIESLVQYSEEILDAASPGILFKMIIAKARMLLKAERCTMYMVYKSRHGDVEAREVESAGLEEGNPTPVDHGVLEYILKHGKSLNILNVQSSSILSSPHPAQCLLYVPLIAYTRIVGLLEFADKMADFYFTNLDEHVARILASYCALWCI